MKLHAMIDKLNPSLRSVEEFNGKTRKREFYQMSAHQAYSILETIAEINNLQENLVLVEPTAQDIKAEEEAEEMRTKRTHTTLPRMDWLIEQGVVKIGDELHLINHPEVVAVLKDSNNVTYNGRVMSIQKWAREITGWQAVQTYAFIKQVGSKQTLSELREEKMRELGMIE